MIKFLPSFTLVLFLGFFAKPSAAQVEIDLVDCGKCLWLAHNDSIFQWQPYGRAHFNPKGIFDLSYGSMAIAQVKHNTDTLLNTYIVQDFQNQDYKYWNGSGWQSLAIAPLEEKVIGFGGYGKHIYLMVGYAIGDLRIFYYNGDTIKPIHRNSKTEGADIAVDSLGRAWFCAGTPMAEVNYFHVIDSSGKILKQYPIDKPFGDYNIYGMAIVKDTIYVGVGPNAQKNSSSVMAFVIEADSAKLQHVIYQAQTSRGYQDLASYQPGIPNRQPKPEPPKNPDAILVYPNPTSGIINIVTTIAGKVEFKLFDDAGQLIVSKTLVADETVNIAHLASATYTYSVSVQGMVKKGVIVKH